MIVDGIVRVEVITTSGRVIVVACRKVLSWLATEVKVVTSTGFDVWKIVLKDMATEVARDMLVDNKVGDAMSYED